MTTQDIHESPTTPAREPDVLAKRLLTIKQAAEILGVGRSTVYELIANDELEVVHIGRSARVPTSAIDDFIAQLRAQCAS